MSNLLQMILDLPPIPVSEKELNTSLDQSDEARTEFETFGDLIRNRHQYSAVEFAKLVADTVRKNSILANINQSKLIEYLQKCDMLSGAMSIWKTKIEALWNEKVDLQFNANKFAFLIISYLPLSIAKLNTLYKKLQEAYSLDFYSKPGFIFSEFCTAIRLRLDNDLSEWSDYKQVTAQLNNQLKDESIERYKSRIKIARAFRDKLQTKDRLAYQEYFYVCVKDYPQQLEKLIEAHENKIIEEEKNLLNKFEQLIQDIEDEKEFLDSYLEAPSFISGDLELKNLIEEYRALNFDIEVTNAANYYASLTQVTNKMVGAASYLNPFAYSLWKQSPPQTPALEFTAEVNDTETTHTKKN